MDDPTATVSAVHRSATHAFSKQRVDVITLHEGLGVEGDAHYGATVQHRSRVAVDPSQPNLRQVHLIQSELFDEVAQLGYDVSPGALGENVTTFGVDLLGLPVGTRLTIGDAAVVTVTGLRNPCQQINDLGAGLLKHMLVVDADGTVTRRAGVLGIVSRSGTVRPGDAITVALPPPPYFPLTRV